MSDVEREGRVVLAEYDVYFLFFVDRFSSVVMTDSTAVVGHDLYLYMK
jgi:hypothetical protein